MSSFTMHADKFFIACDLGKAGPLNIPIHSKALLAAILSQLAVLGRHHE